MMVGGNIRGQTRVMTTAIVLETRQGEFGNAIVLGAILPLYPVLFSIHQRIGRYDEVVEEFKTLRDEHEKIMEAHHG